MKKIYILPFDHRSSFTKDILGIEIPNKNQKKEIKNLKTIIFNGLQKSLEGRKDKKDFSILVDEEYGLDVIKKAQENKIKICLPVEKSGENILKLEYGKHYKDHIKKISPDFVKILVRYNPENIKENKKQLEILNEIYSFCKKNKYKTILELLVPPTDNDMIICKNKETYDKKLRTLRTKNAIREIKKAIKPTIWKLEGFSFNQWKDIINETKNNKIIVLGRGEDDKKVRQWLKDAAKYETIIGFAIGRTIFMDPIKEYYLKEISSDKAISLISNKFLGFVSIWEKEKNYENI
ncbi:DUF2090 domain-containing protein [bacterium]|nr:DUF2090 domain-containing protein [bacterium]